MIIPRPLTGRADGGERLWKQTSTGLQVWIGGLYELHNGLGRFHILANGRRICVVEPATSTTHYNHGDHLGSASVLTSAAGTETRHWEYSPYGRERFGTTQPFAVSHRFTGQVFDDETGLYYYGARYYDPNLGRFIQADTVIPDLGNPQSLNRYAYTLNNPLKYTDPNGHVVETVWDLANIGIGVGSLIGNIKEGNVGASIVDSVGIVLDSAAAVVPFVPGGVGATIKAVRIGDKAVDAAKAANKLDKAKDVANTVDNAADGGKKLGNAAEAKPKQLDLELNDARRQSDNAYDRVKPRESTKAEVNAKQEKGADGKFIDPKTGKPVDPQWKDLGHQDKPWAVRREEYKKEGLTRKEVIERENNSDNLRWEEARIEAGQAILFSVNSSGVKLRAGFGFPC